MKRASSLAVCALALSGACSSSPVAPRDSGAFDISPVDGAAFDGAREARTNEGGDADHAPASGDAARTPLFGSVDVDLIDDHTAFSAAFFDGAPLPAMPLDGFRTSGDCQLLVPRASCAQGCAAGSVCVGSDLCAPQPNAVNVGTLHVEGLGTKPLELTPTSPTNLTYQAVPTLPPSACVEGDAVTARAATFSLAGKCVGALALTTAVPVPVTSGHATHLAWTPPGHAGISRVAIVLEISHHGGYKGEIDCDVADTGAFDIPEPLVTALVALGRAGYPTVKVVRTSSATAPEAPGVRLEIVSRAEVAVDTGIISCGNDATPGCPAGTTCQLDYTCR
jgi:hypothetical protein